MNKKFNEVIKNYENSFNSLPEDSIHLSMLDKYIRKGDKLFVHNYSPRPKSPFVLNLASIDEENYHLTEQMIINNIELSQKLSAPYYSLHAGYASDISPSMLGNEITSDAYSSREEIFELFTKRTKYFSELAYLLVRGFVI